MLLGDRLVAIKVLKNLIDNVEYIEEEYRIFKNLSRHDNFPTFYGGFLNKFDKADKDELWLVMEVGFSLFIPLDLILIYVYFYDWAAYYFSNVKEVPWAIYSTT
jgi:hypothetical protein